MNHVITTRGLTKAYGGTTVVDRLNLAVPEGSVYGFVGPNGSGKTTTMKMLLSLVQPSAGEVQVLGSPMHRGTRRQVLSQVGSLIESPPGYGHLTGAENMAVVANMLGLERPQVDAAVHTVRLTAHMDKQVKKYSLGMKQRLGIAMALARNPRVLILDEPTNGLDPAGIEEIRQLLRELAGRGVTIMVSSHLLSEIDRTANVLGVLGRGRLVFQGTRDQLFARSLPDVLIDTPEPDRAATLAAPWRGTRTTGGVRVSGLDRPTTAEVVAHLVGHGVAIYGVRRQEQTLEDIFMALTGGGGL